MHTDIIILDEPTIAQDLAGVLRLGQLVSELQAEGRTVIAITHDMDFTVRWFDRVLVFCEGRVLADDSPANAFARQDILARAALEAPQLVQLGHNLGFMDAALSTEEFVRQVSRQISPA